MSSDSIKIHLHLRVLLKHNQVLHIALDIELKTSTDGVNSHQSLEYLLLMFHRHQASQPSLMQLITVFQSSYTQHIIKVVHLLQDMS